MNDSRKQKKAGNGVGPGELARRLGVSTEEPILAPLVAALAPFIERPDDQDLAYQPCPRCRGRGMIASDLEYGSETDCPRCEGTGLSPNARGVPDARDHKP